MPDTPLPSKVSTGLVCANCEAEFEESHGQPVICPRCHSLMKSKGRRVGLLPMAWHELKVVI